MSSATANDSIARSASRLRWLVIAAVAAMVLLYASARFGLPFGPAHVELKSHIPGAAMSYWVADAGLVLLVIALFRLTQMLGAIATGELFSARVVGRFRSFAFWLLLTALFGLVAPFVAALAQPGAGQRLELRIDFREVLTVGVTLVLFLIARLLERARRIDEEMREFV